MRDLLYKEFKLCIHPMMYAFLSFVLMLLIPSYTYLVPCFFICNAIFYSFQQSVTNNDPSFTLLLPVSKSEAVKSKIAFVAIIQMAMLVLYIPMIAVNNAVIGIPNKMLDACPTLIGAGFTVFALFNIVFIPSFYKTCFKVGKSFLIATIAVFAWIFLLEGFFLASNLLSESSSFFNWIETHIDCTPVTGGAWIAQLCAVAAGAAIYVVSLVVTHRLAVKNFERVDL